MCPPQERLYLPRSSMAPQLQGCSWVSSWLRLQHPAPWPYSARVQRRRVLHLAPPRRSYAGLACVVTDACPALVLEPVVGAEFPSEDVGAVLGQDEEDLDERERLRRFRISKANKGNTPWNKGRKHSPETLQRIRERTRIAMQDPKVKKKLMNLGHRQSKETRIKISEGVRRGWYLRLQKLMVQDGCFVEWRDMVADAARTGFAGGVSLQWNSYKILTEQKQQEWLENFQKKKSMPRPKGNRRAPKTPEQRRKIAEAIAAKWLDQEYRERVCSGIASYHGTSTGIRAPRKPRPAREPGVKTQTIKKKTTHASAVGLEDAHSRVAIVRRKKIAAHYKDPMAGEKLEMITKIRAQRAALEIEKKEAIRRARSLIAEAKKAADALETAAATSPFAQASLIEARKLFKEAQSSLQCVGEGDSESASDDSAVLDFHNNGLDIQNQGKVMKQENKHLNGLKFAPSNVNGTGFHFNISTLNEMENLFRRTENSMETAFLLPSGSTPLNNVSGDFGLIDLQVSQQMVNENNATESTENCPLGVLKEEASASVKKVETTNTCPGTTDEEGTPSTSDRSKVRWVRGRLVTADNGGFSET